MKIKLTGYPYKEYKIGDIVDFGDEKNKSLVSFGRAVWADEGILVPVIDVKKVVKKVVKKGEGKNKDEEEIVEIGEEAKEELKEVEEEEVTAEIADIDEEEDSGESNSFWGKFKAKKQSE